MTFIADSAELAGFCARQAKASYLTIDTEFLRDSTYWPRLCVVQVGGPEEAAAVDTLAPDIDLEPLLRLFDDRGILKVIHSGRQDMEIFFQLTGRLPAPVFDTQVAAMVCGFGDSVAYDTLARKLTGARIDKSSRFTDWSVRPLRKRQLDYALADVTHLRPIYENLKSKLESSGRAHWLDQEMASLTSPDTYRQDPADAWKRLKTRSTDRRYLAVLRELAAWREREAQRRDVPRNRVIRDEQLFDIAAHRPKTEEELARTRGFNRDMAKGRFGQAVLKVIADGNAVPEADCPEALQKHELPSGLGPLMDLLKVLLKMKCEQQDVAQKLVASSADLELIAALGEDAKVPALAGWRREVFGADALRLKAGRLALSARGRKIKLVKLNGESKAD